LPAFLPRPARFRPLNAIKAGAAGLQLQGNAMYLGYRVTRMRLAMVDCIARIVLSLCIALAAGAVFVGALVLIAGEALAGVSRF
jgi:hypothetical protein